MPGWEDPNTGLIRPDGPDYVSDIPAIERDFLRRLAPMLRITVASVTDRNALYPRPGLNERPIVSIPSLDEEHRWDGKQWLIFDTRPKWYTPLWYAGADLTALEIKDGTIKGWYQRQGHTMKWKIELVRGANSHFGDSYYSFYLPKPVRNLLEVGTGVVRSGGVEYAGAVTFRDNSRPILVIGGSRVGYQTYTWAAGDAIILAGENMLGGLL